MTEDRRKKILVVDDDHVVRQLLHSILGDLYDVSCLSSGSQMYALLTACRADFDLVITDICMAGWDGDEGEEMVKAMGVDIPFIFITGYATPGALDGKTVIQKPFSMSNLLATIALTLYCKPEDKEKE